MTDRQLGPDAFDDTMHAWMHRTAPPAAPGFLLGSVRMAAERTRQDRRGPGRWALAAVAVASGAMAVGIAIGIPNGRDQGPPIASDPVHSASASASAAAASEAPSASPQPDGSGVPAVEGWQRATVELPASNSSGMAAVARGTDGFVAVGGGGSVEGLGGALAWYSSDGQRWELTLDLHAEQDGSSLWDVVATADGFVAVGHDPGGPAVWRSTDGRSWTTIDDPSAPAGPAHSLSSVAAHRGGLLAIGYASEGDAQVATAWSSVDGSTWTRLAAPDSYATGRPGALAVREDGGGIIVGSLGPDLGDPVAWPITGDGIGDPVVLPANEGETHAGPAVATADGFVILGGRWDAAEAAYQLLAWTSDDGSAWEIEEAGSIGLAGGAAFVHGVGLVVVGQTYRLETSEVAMWQRTRDGEWTTRLIEDSNGGGAGVTTDPNGRLIVIGSDDPDGSATVWLEP
jgi:hypothetical protein